MNKFKLKSTVMSGLLYSNPVFKLMLGMCPTLAVTTTLFNSLGMGLATTFVLVCSNIIISLLRKVIPDKIRIPCYIIIIATFVTMVEMLLYKFLPELYDSLGVFIALITVNCIILARAEAFASVNPVLDSTVDGLSMGIGFTIGISILGIFREVLSSGKILGMQIIGDWFPFLSIFSSPAGGFLMLGLLMAVFNAIFNRIQKVKNRKIFLEQMTIGKTKNNFVKEGVEESLKVESQTAKGDR